MTNYVFLMIFKLIFVIFRSRAPLKVKVCASEVDEGGRYLILKLEIDGSQYILGNIYGPNTDNPLFFSEVFGKLEEIGSAGIILTGDLNLAVGPLDYIGSRSCHSNVQAKEQFNAYIEEFTLIDVWRREHGDTLGFTRQQQTPLVSSRLDYIFVSSELISQVQGSEIYPGICSDHSLVSMKFNLNGQGRGKGYWKCNCHYLRHDVDFVNFIKDKIKEYREIHKESDVNPNTMWDAFKCYITGFCIQYSSRKKKEKNESKDKLLHQISNNNKELTKLQSQSNCDAIKIKELFNEKERLENELNDILDRETAGLIVRSRIKWAEHGEKSTKYFCNLEKRNNERKTIRQIKSRDGEILKGMGHIQETIHQYYESLYSSQFSQDDAETASLFLSGLDTPRILENQKENLNSPITKAELRSVLKQMPSNKTPGLDGLPSEFYEVFFEDIADMLMASYNYSFDNGILSQTQRYGVITLLLKDGRDPLEMKSYRPISLLNVDYKLIAKVMSQRLKRVITSLIHTDQQGFLSGRNISSNIRTIIDLIEYSDFENIPGSIVLLDFEKAFDRIEHGYLFKVLEQYNLGDNFIKYVKTFYMNRSSFVINNGNMTESIQMSRGIFQGCPISPYLFVLAIEMLAIAIRDSPEIKGINIGDEEKKISLFADDTICFLNGEMDSFLGLFQMLHYFESFSGCHINMSKSEAIHIGSLKNSERKPFEENGLKWNSKTFKALGVTFSIDVKQLYALNFPIKLKKIEQVVNCWKQRHLSLIGKITVVKSLLLPQLLYLFSVLCIDIPQTFFKKLNSILYKFIWNNGNDRVKRTLLCEFYENSGLKMIDPQIYSKAQKMIWVKHLLDENYEAAWKHIEIKMLKSFHDDPLILWKTEAPHCVLNKLKNCQLIENLKIWYEYKHAVVNELNLISYHMQDMIWYNKNVNLRHRPYFYYHAWYERGIVYISDLYNGINGVMTFEDLVLEYDIPITDRRKYDSLMNGIFLNWFEDQQNVNENIFDKIVVELVKKSKVPKHAYSLLRCVDTLSQSKIEIKWENSLGLERDDVDWHVVHTNNFKCTIETQLRSFYFKVFHNAIALNSFLYKIGRSDSPMCYFCQMFPETLKHLFCECTVVGPIWQKLTDCINDKINEIIVYHDFNHIFGVVDGGRHDMCITFLFLCLKFYIIRCKFQQTDLNFDSFISFVKMKQKIEYRIAEKKGKLGCHFKKWSISPFV